VARSPHSLRGVPSFQHVRFACHGAVRRDWARRSVGLAWQRCPPIGRKPDQPAPKFVAVNVVLAASGSYQAGGSFPGKCPRLPRTSRMRRIRSDMAMEFECMLDRRQAAAFLTARGYRTAPATLAKLACIGGGPTFESFGRKPLYREADLLAWARAKTTGPRRSTSDPGAGPSGRGAG
jgi:hypothetical protein